MTTIEQTTPKAVWHSRSAGDVTAELGVDPDRGLDGGEVERRLSQYGPNELPQEPPPSVWEVARGQLSNPMNIMLLIVAVASFVVGQVPTGIFVLGLVTFNVVMGSAQELKARASVEALAQLQVPHARVRRNGAVEEVESTKLVPGDIALLEAGDVVPADGRIVTSATLELQEAALTGESAPVAKDGTSVLDVETALGDRINLVFQNTQVTRGAAAVVVTATGSATEMGRIADMVTATQRQRSPLQKELDGMTKVFGLVAWLAVAVIAIFGIARGQSFDTVVLLVHLDRDRVDPGGPADIRAGDAVLGRSAAGRVEGGGEIARRRRDARRDDRDQQRQDRDADAEPDDRDHDAGRRRLVPGGGRRLPQVRRDPRGGRLGASRFPAPGAGADAVQRRHGGR